MNVLIRDTVHRSLLSPVHRHLPVFEVSAVPPRKYLPIPENKQMSSGHISAYGDALMLMRIITMILHLVDQNRRLRPFVATEEERRIVFLPGLFPRSSYTHLDKQQTRTSLFSAPRYPVNAFTPDLPLILR